jgi:hypothetical protein
MEDIPQKKFWILTALILTAGLALRVIAALGYLEHDEIWTVLQIAQFNAESFFDILRINHDNNHILNTLYLKWVGQTSNWISYRLLSLAAGAGVLGLMGFIAAAQSRRAALWAMLCTAFSFPLIAYSAQARGYSLAMFFALLAFVLAGGADKNKETGNAVKPHTAKPLRAAFFGVTVVLGFLSHLTFLFVYLALLAWMAFRAIRSMPTKRSAMLSILAYHGLPLVFLALFYLFFVSRLAVGGAPYGSLLVSIRDLAILFTGAKASLQSVILGMIAIAAVLLSGLILLHRQKDDCLVFFFMLFFAASGVALLAAGQEFLYWRYFLLLFPFFYLLFAFVLASAGDFGRPLKAVALVLAVLYLAGQGFLITDLIAKRDNNHSAVMEYLALKTDGPEVIYGGMPEFLVLRYSFFWTMVLKPQKMFSFVRHQMLEQYPPEWFVVETSPTNKALTAELTLPGGHLYQQHALFPRNRFSGDIAVYKKQEYPGIMPLP